MQGKAAGVVLVDGNVYCNIILYEIHLYLNETKSIILCSCMCCECLG